MYFPFFFFINSSFSVASVLNSSIWLHFVQFFCFFFHLIFNYNRFVAIFQHFLLLFRWWCTYLWEYFSNHPEITFIGWNYIFKGMISFCCLVFFSKFISFLFDSVLNLFFHHLECYGDKMNEFITLKYYLIGLRMLHSTAHDESRRNFFFSLSFSLLKLFLEYFMMCDELTLRCQYQSLYHDIKHNRSTPKQRLHDWRHFQLLSSTNHTHPFNCQQRWNQMSSSSWYLSANLIGKLPSINTENTFHLSCKNSCMILINQTHSFSHLHRCRVPMKLVIFHRCIIEIFYKKLAFVVGMKE